jgi:hypothetical protein
MLMAASTYMRERQELLQILQQAFRILPQVESHHQVA